MGFSCTLCGLGPRMSVFVIGTITLVFSVLMAGLATTAILAYNCDIDMTQSNETYGLYLYYFRSKDCGPINLRYLGLGNVTISLGEPDVTSAVERTFVFAVVAAALHGALAVTTILLFGTMCVSCLGRGCVVLGFYPWILAMFLVLALDLTGFVVYLIDFINVMDVEGVIELLEFNNTPQIRNLLERVDDIYLVAPSLFMWLAFSKGVLFWFMFVIFLAVVISLSMQLWKENKPAPAYSNKTMQPRQVMQPTSPSNDVGEPQPSGSRYFDQAPQQQMQSLPNAPSYEEQSRLYPTIPPPNQLNLPYTDPNVRRTVEPLNDARGDDDRDASPPYQPPSTQPFDPNSAPLQVNQTVDPYTDKRFSYLPGQPAPFSYLAGPTASHSPRSSMNPPPEVRNQLPWSYFPAADELKSKRLTSTLTEEKEFPGEEKQLPTIRVTSAFPDDRSSVTTDEGKWSGPEYKY